MTGRPQRRRAPGGARPCCLSHRARETLATIVPAEFAALLEGMTPDQARELVEDLADGDAARQALEEPGEDIPAEQVCAELGLT